MHMVQAWERLNDHDYSSKLNMEDFHDLLIRAGYSASAAERAAKQRGWDRLQAGVTV